jgi:hypothetical protein
MGARGVRLPELAGLPDWPPMTTEAAAAAYLCQSSSDFACGVDSGDLPPPRRDRLPDQRRARDMAALGW